MSARKPPEEVQASNRARHKAWRDANVEHVRAKGRAAYWRAKAADPERIREAGRRNDAKRALDPVHRAKVAARAGAWARANKERYQAHCVQSQHRRRAQKQGAAFPLTTAQWLEIVETFNGACAYCLRTDRKLTVDHVIPLSRGGDHTYGNVVPACQSCNSRKHARGPLAMINQKAA